jgi:hypothetical protein
MYTNPSNSNGIAKWTFPCLKFLIVRLQIVVLVSRLGTCIFRPANGVRNARAATDREARLTDPMERGSRSAVRKFGTRRLTAVFARDLYWLLFCTRAIHSTCAPFSHLPAGCPGGLLPARFPTKALHAFPSCRASSVDIAVGHGVEGRGSILRRFPAYRPHRLWAQPPSLISNKYRTSFPEVKRPGREADYWTPYSAEVQKCGFICISSLPNVFMAQFYLHFTLRATLPAHFNLVTWS